MFDTKITDKDGNVSNLYDALDNNGNLKSEFQTEVNVNTYEHRSTKEFHNFINKVERTIVDCTGITITTAEV